MRERGADDTPPDQYVTKDVSELRSDFGRLDERIKSVEQNSVTYKALAGLAIPALISLLIAAVAAYGMMNATVARLLIQQPITNPQYQLPTTEAENSN